jgi:HlyD family secretion protein
MSTVAGEIQFKTRVSAAATKSMGWMAHVASGWRLGTFLLGAVLLFGAGALYWVFRDGGTPKYVTAAVSRGSVMQAVTATGSVNPMLTVTVGTYVSGVIQQINCDFNTRVTKGQLCATIDPRPYQAVVDQDRANLVASQAQLQKDRANLAYSLVNERRYASLISSGATSRDSYDNAVNMLDQARAQVALDEAAIGQHQAVLEAALVNLGYTKIVSPVDGIVVSRNVTKGQTVAASFQTPTLFLIAEDLSKVQVDTNVSESDIGGIRLGHTAQFRVEAFPDRTFVGVVSQIRQAPQSVQNVVTYDVVVTASNNALLLKPGMTATVRIVTDKRENVLRVPDQAMRYAPGGIAANDERSNSTAKQVWVVRAGKPVRVAIRTGLDDDSFTEITSGSLKEGDRVILSEGSGSGSRARAVSGGSSPSMRFP